MTEKNKTNSSTTTISPAILNNNSMAPNLHSYESYKIEEYYFFPVYQTIHNQDTKACNMSLYTENNLGSMHKLIKYLETVNWFSFTFKRNSEHFSLMWEIV